MRTELYALMVTIGVEFAVYMAFVRQNWRVVLLNSILINALTQPLASLVMERWFNRTLHDWWTGFVLVELAVIGVETPLIRVLFDFPWKRAFVMSLVANVLSASFSFVN